MWAFINYATGQIHRVPMEIVRAFEIVSGPPAPSPTISP
jgi:hypothetical protein